tara:strand:- start:95 stop:973 length:879 start_codon:yes stop_codon:yes gene_type:complete
MSNDDYYSDANIEDRSCILTGQISDTCRSQWKEWEIDGKAVAYKCDKCKNVLLDPSPNDEALGQFYSQYSEHRLEKNKKNGDRKHQYKNDVEIALQHIQAGRLLDIGCSTGEFLNSFPNDFQKFGMDLDPSAIAYAQETHTGNKFGILDLDWQDEEGFDLITMRGVIEHVRDPALYLSFVCRNLKPGGLFYVCATPNLSSPIAQIFRKKWRLWHTVEHITIFSKAGLNTLCETHGLVPKAWTFDYLDTPYADYDNDVVILEEAIETLRSGGTLDMKSPPFFDAMLNCIYEKR